MMVFEREQPKDKNIFFSNTRGVPLRIEVSDREIKVIDSNREVVLPKDFLNPKAILDRLGIGREGEFSQEIYL
ncbi:MAG: hypothetical protein GU344_02040 [Thermocrinis sp.]|jgi:hypothetical protein|nr:hypothetical protein [Thermocrinis sp.]